MSRIGLLEAVGQVGVSLDAAGNRVVILFANEGPLAASVQIGDGPKEMLTSEN